VGRSAHAPIPNAIAGLQVAMDDALFVRRIERVQDLLGHVERLSDRYRSVQRFAFVGRHRDIDVRV
jgi:hypothetical protein